MDTAGALDQGRLLFEQGDWQRAFDYLVEANAESELPAADLERLAAAAYLIGSDDRADDAMARAHRSYLRAGEPGPAVRCAFWLGFGLMDRGESAQAGGWLARAGRILGELDEDCAERGYMLVPSALKALDEGDARSALELFVETGEIANRFDDPDLRALSLLGQGQSLVQIGDVERGIAILDEVMVAITAEDVQPIVIGIVYCGVIFACQQLLDVRRAQEWTEALTRWCQSHPELVPFRGQCLVYRSELLRRRGAWSEAINAAELACGRLSDPHFRKDAGAAYYELGELHRLRGDFDDAEAAYRQASRWGRTPEPGLVRLRVAQGRVDAAAAATRRMMGEGGSTADRLEMLSAHVEIMLAAGDLRSARDASAELSKIAGEFGAPLALATAAEAAAAVSLAEGNPQEALASARRAAEEWQRLEAPYDAARSRVLIGRCCMELGDAETAHLEWESALAQFRALEASPDASRVEQMLRGDPPNAVPGLSRRESEILRLIAAGKTNRAIAAELFISEKTVARHVSNIFTKLGISSRAAATAHAYEHDLL